MKRLALAAAAIGLVAACSREAPPVAPSPTPGASPVRVVPPEYAGRVNPLPDDEATFARGREAFLKTCAPCHGPNGDGNGIAAAALKPPPANFRDGKRIRGRPDDVLFWEISTGIPDSAMPAFGATLSEEERWAILRFLRRLSETPS